MPRWFLGCVAVIALVYSGVITYAYIDERDKHDEPARAIFGASYLERMLPVTWTEDQPNETLTEVACVLRDGHNYKCVADAVPTTTAIDLALQPDATARERRTTRESMTHTVGFDVTLDPANGKFVTNVP